MGRIQSKLPQSDVDNDNDSGVSLSSIFKSLEHLYIRPRRLKVQGEIGAGGYGQVYLATLDESKRHSRTVAVKHLSPRGIKGYRKRMAFRLARELKIWSNLEHPNILGLLGYYLCDNYEVAQLISVYMLNGNVSSYIAERRPNVITRLKFVQGITAGLKYLHDFQPPISHGDLKPANVLISDDLDAVLCDFGLASFINDDGSPSGLTTSQALKGSLRYMSFELLMGTEKKRTLPADIWAWACTTYEIFTDEKPYNEVEAVGAVVVKMVEQRIPGSPEVLLARLPQNETSSTRLSEAIIDCWDFKPIKRPSVATLVEVCDCPPDEVADSSTGVLLRLDGRAERNSSAVPKSDDADIAAVQLLGDNIDHKTLSVSSAFPSEGKKAQTHNYLSKMRLQAFIPYSGRGRGGGRGGGGGGPRGRGRGGVVIGAIGGMAGGCARPAFGAVAGAGGPEKETSTVPLVLVNVFRGRKYLFPPTPNPRTSTRVEAMTVRRSSYGTCPLQFSSTIPRLINNLGDRALINNTYTAVLLERWNMLYERARTAQNMAVCGVSYSKKCILVISVEGYVTRPWRAVPGSQTDRKFWTMLGMRAGWDVEVVADSLPIWDPTRQPSKNNIRSFAHEYLKDNKEGDQFIVVFSGQCDDQGLMLADGSHISPQELRDWFVKPLASGSRLWTFFDCSESSNLLGLRYKIEYKRSRGTIYYRPAQSYAGYHDEDIRGTVISIGSAAGDCGEMVLFDGDESTQPVSCGALAWGVYYFFHAFCTEGEPLLAIFFPLMEMVLKSRSGQEVQITTSSKVRKPALPMLRAPS